MTAPFAVASLDPGRRGIKISARGHINDLQKVFRTCSPPIKFRLSDLGLLLSFSDSDRLREKLGPALRWEPLLERFLMNRIGLSARITNARSAAEAIQITGPEEIKRRIGSLALTLTLDAHQVVNVAILTLPDSVGGCIFDEQGTGKTVTMIAAYDVLVERNDADTLLIIAPKSMIGEWKREFDRFSNGLYKVVVAEGSKKAKAAALHSGADVIVTNYETAASCEDDLILLARRCRLVLAVDESYNVKNPQALRTQALADLREWCVRAYVLCGTPAPNSPADVVSQFDLVDFGYTFSGVDLSTDREQIGEPIRLAMEERGLYVRNLKSKVLPDLPERRFTDVHVNMSEAQSQAYGTALSGLINEVRGIDESSFKNRRASFLEKRAALLRICNGRFDGDSEIHAPTPKILALDGILSDAVQSRKEKVVLWSFYRANLDYLAGRYARYGIVRIDGTVTDSAVRRSAVERFQNDPEVRIFLGNPAAAGSGLTLHSARLAVYESLSNQTAHYLQSLDRIHRRGQTRPVEYITLLCTDTLEETEYGRLIAKAMSQAELLGDPVQTRETRDVFLARLIDAQLLLERNGL